MQQNHTLYKVTYKEGDSKILIHLNDKDIIEISLYDDEIHPKGWLQIRSVGSLGKGIRIRPVVANTIGVTVE